MLAKFEAEAEGCANIIAIADVAMTKAGKDTKSLTKWLKTVVPSAIKWSTSLHWVVDDEKKAERTWLA